MPCKEPGGPQGLSPLSSCAWDQSGIYRLQLLGTSKVFNKEFGTEVWLNQVGEGLRQGIE